MSAAPPDEVAPADPAEVPAEEPVAQAGGAIPRAVAVVGFLAAAVVVAAGIAAAAWLVTPVFLGLVIVVMVYPLHARMLRAGWPGWLAVTVLVIAVYAVVLVFAGVVVLSLARLATALPGYVGEANALLRSLLSVLAELGVGAEELRVLASAMDAGKLVGIVGGVLQGITSLAANLVFLLSLLLFLGIEATGARARLQVIAASRPGVAAALVDFAGGTRRFLAVTTVIGLVTGAVDTVFLWGVGVPLAPLWGLLVFVTNYIPYVGFWIGAIPPVLLALLVGGWGTALLVVAVFLVVNFVLTSVVQPKFVGDAVGLSVSVTLVALVFWAWLLGPLGAVLAVPLTLLVKVLLVDADPRARWADALVGTTPRPISPGSG
ncbi:AI-2E family transporter [Pseudonocardia thermophila]|uniref:AI-2E family transporter n=1 Tax=Pseudonocardia thermophila TaxID=1848 RepID=UPI001F3C4307|nr:AI-2E family transporter [Pseudonocardia thermophila]